jgi:hypothetical protein
MDWQRYQEARAQTMPEYQVTCMVNLLATDPTSAAEGAQELMRDPSSEAHIFKVTDLGAINPEWSSEVIDLRQKLVGAYTDNLDKA